MTGYSVEIVNSTKELTGKEKIMVKDTSNAVKIDDVTNNGNSITISPKILVTLKVHNEKSQDKDYLKYVIIDENGDKYVTGSASFIEALGDIMAEMSEEEEKYSVVIYKMPSKNYQGKSFITCSIS